MSRMKEGKKTKSTASHFFFCVCFIDLLPKMFWHWHVWLISKLSYFCHKGNFRPLKKKKKDQFFVICLLRLLSAHVATLSLCLKSIYPSSFSPPPPPFTSFIIGFIDPETCPIQFRQWGTLNTHKEEIRARKLMGLSDSLSEKERPRERVCVWTYVWGISQGCCEKPSHGCKQLNTHTHAQTHAQQIPQYPMISSWVTAQYDKHKETGYNEKRCWKRGKDGLGNVCVTLLVCVCV